MKMDLIVILQIVIMNGWLKMKCCICGKEIEGFGNNPWPVNNNDRERCCDDCNWTVVIPARMLNLRRREAMKCSQQEKNISGIL